METREKTMLLNKIERVRDKLENLISKACWVVLLFAVSNMIAVRLALDGFTNGEILVGAVGLIFSVIFVLYFAYNTLRIRVEYSGVFVDLVNYITMLRTEKGYGTVTFDCEGKAERGE